ncbi:uncharacterized protein THITE_2022607, partial [Thermothielavioides terrestris NRRL 8126]
LNISRAFNTVNYPRLLATLQDLSYPRWLGIIRKDKVAAEAKTLPITIGLTLSSPLSPMLFLLYISTLYRVLKERHPYLGLVEFANDTNLLAFCR